MKRQSAISAVFSPASKRVLEANVPGESSEDSIDMQQVAISSNIDNKSCVPSTDVTSGGYSKLGARGKILIRGPEKLM